MQLQIVLNVFAVKLTFPIGSHKVSKSIRWQIKFFWCSTICILQILLLKSFLVIKTKTLFAIIFDFL